MPSLPTSYNLPFPYDLIKQVWRTNEEPATYVLVVSIRTKNPRAIGAGEIHIKSD